MIVLKPVRSPSRSRGGRTSTKSPSDKRVVRKPAYRRRNPDFFGTSVADVGYAIGGGYLSWQLAGILSSFAAPIVEPIRNFFDRFRPGLGDAAVTTGSAVGVGWGARRWLNRHIGNVAQFGGIIVGANQALASVAPGVNALEGQPQIAKGGSVFTLLKGGKSDKKAVPTQTAAAVNAYNPNYPHPAVASDDVGI